MEGLFALANWLKAKLGWFKATLAITLFVIAYFTYGAYQNEKHYHAWAGSYTVHQFDYKQVEYKDGNVRVFWVSFPKTAPYGFEEQYILHRHTGEPLGIHEFEHPYPRAEPYRDGYTMDSTNIKVCNCWGSWINVGKLEPGSYQLEIRYDYDPWWLPDWSADQRVVFIVGENK